ncbi:MAG: hypothetical protein MI753_00420 [Hyphomicrobiales bacterium]|nr:hypothetical protein [Hyphomicrobiales bacterium]
MANAVELARMLTPRQRQALEILANAERPLRNKDFHERFKTDGRRTTGWAKALGPCTKTRNHDLGSLWARGLVTVTNNRYYKITPNGSEVAAVMESGATRPTVRHELPCVDGAPAIGPSGNSKEPCKLTPQAGRPNEQLSEFRSELAKLLPSPISRPFLCHGSPLKCRIFIVGTNSRVEVKKPFWSFWSDSRGFEKLEFVRELEQLHRGLKVTRKNIERVACAAGPTITLDTNVYLPSTRTKRELQREDKKTDVIEYLLKTIRPKVVLAHGGEAKKFFRRHCRDFVDDSVTPRHITWDAWQWQFRLLCSHHLSFQGKEVRHAEEAERIGEALADALR